MKLPPSYHVAIRAGQNALDRITAPGSEGADVEIAVGTFLFWIVALDDRIRELNETEHAVAVTMESASSVMPGLKLARNALAHGVVPVSLPGGFTLPFTLPLVIHPLRWAPLSQLTDGWTPRRSPNLAQQIQVFEEQLAERDTVPTLQSAFNWAARFAPERLPMS